MFPDGRTGKATKKMLLKHNLWMAAWEMNIVPGLHLALVSIPKLADAGYMMILTKHGATIYDDNTTSITASNIPSLNPIGAKTLDCGDSTFIQTTNMQLPRQSMSSSISYPLTKLFFGTMHQQDSHKKKHSLTPSAMDTMQHGRN